MFVGEGEGGAGGGGDGPAGGALEGGDLSCGRRSVRGWLVGGGFKGMYLLGLRSRRRSSRDTLRALFRLP